MVDVELLTKDNWQDFLKEPKAVLMLGKTTCEACKEWTADLKEWSDSPEGIRFGKINLDEPGWGRFKLQEKWVSEVDVLPFNAIYIDGENKKSWAGGGLDRLSNRLNRFI